MSLFDVPIQDNPESPPMFRPSSALGLEVKAFPMPMRAATHKPDETTGEMDVAGTLLKLSWGRWWTIHTMVEVFLR